jgi:hypothetical protein
LIEAWNEAHEEKPPAMSGAEFDSVIADRGTVH